MDIIELMCLYLDSLGLNETDVPDLSHLYPGCAVYYKLSLNNGMSRSLKVTYRTASGMRWLGISRRMDGISIWSNGDGDEFHGKGFIEHLDAIDPNLLEKVNALLKREGVLI